MYLIDTQLQIQTLVIQTSNLKSNLLQEATAPLNHQSPSSFFFLSLSLSLYFFISVKRLAHFPSAASRLSNSLPTERRLFLLNAFIKVDLD